MRADDPICVACARENPAGASFCEACGGDLRRAWSTCGSCGHVGRDGARHCTRCAAALPRPPRADACRACGVPRRPLDRFCAACGHPVGHPAGAAVVVAPVTEAASPAAEPVEDERKLVTVLFADVSGFTAMSERLDPEDVRDIMDRCFDVLTREITSRGGTIDKFIGDAVMAYFGVPIAHEDDAPRAIRSAIAMQVALADFSRELERSHGLCVAMRIGLNTGRVLAGQIGGDDHRDFTVYGDTVNTASRLEHAAERGTILISRSTYQASRGWFDFESLPPLSVKGKEEPLTVYRVAGERRRPTSLGMRGVEGVDVPMLGRDLELRVLTEWMDQTRREGTPSVVNVVGVAGIGKTRLTSEALGRVTSPDVSILRGRCLPPGSSAPWNLLRDLAFALVGDDVADAARLESAHGLSRGEAEALAWLERGGSPGEPEAERELQSKRAMSAIRGLVERRAARGELVALVCEDVHWADDATLDFVDRLGEGARGPVIFFCVTRHELFDRRPTWTEGKPHQHRVDLRPLSAVVSKELVEQLLGRLPAPPASLVQQIVTRSGGNAFFMEEMVKVLLDQHILIVDGEAWRLEEGWESRIEVPASIQGLLQARMDALPAQERRALTHAALVGTVFWREAVEALIESDAGAALDAARERGLIHRREVSRIEGAQELAFESAMLHEVLYDRVLRRDRPSKHERVASWMLERAGGRFERAARWPELARHLAGAGRALEALRAHALAADAAMAVHSHAQARAGYERALALLAELGEDALPTEERRALLSAYGRAAARDLALDEATAAYEEAIALGRSTDAPDELAALHTALADALIAGGANARAAAQAQRALDLLADGTCVELRAGALEQLARATFFLGDYARSDALGREALALSPDARVVIRVQRVLQMANNLLGQPEAALTAAREAVERARALDDELLLGQALLSLATARYYARDPEGALVAYEEAQRAADRAGDLETSKKTFNNRGEVLLSLGRTREARDALARAIRQSYVLGLRAQLSDTHRLLAEIHLEVGDLDQARAEGERALALARELGERNFEAQAHRLLACVLARRGEATEAAAAMEQCRAILRAIDATDLLERNERAFTQACAATPP